MRAGDRLRPKLANAGAEVALQSRDGDGAASEVYERAAIISTAGAGSDGTRS